MLLLEMRQVVYAIRPQEISGACELVVNVAAKVQFAPEDIDLLSRTAPS